MRLSCSILVQAYASHQKLNDDLELVTGVKQCLVVAHIPHRHAEEVVYQVRILFALFSRRQTLVRHFHHEVKSFHEDISILGLMTKLAKAKLNRVHERP